MEQKIEEQLTPSNYHQDLIEFVETKIKFRGKTMREWQQALVFPDISDNLTEEELLTINRESIKLFQTIYQNASYAKSHLTASKAALEKSLNNKKITLREDFVNSGKKIPTIDVLHSLAVTDCEKENQSVVMSTIFYDFWEYYIQNIKLYNTRITSLNITKHHEIKNSNY